MKRYIHVKSEFIEIPAGLTITSLRADAVQRIIESVKIGITEDKESIATVGVLKLKGLPDLRITTKRSGGVVYWMIQGWVQKMVLAGGFFREGSSACVEEAAVALPVLRGRGLYISILKYVRKLYKKPLISDRSLSIANILSWVRAGASVGKNRFHINPHKPWIRHFVALETITV